VLWRDKTSFQTDTIALYADFHRARTPLEAGPYIKEYDYGC